MPDGTTLDFSRCRLVMTDEGPSAIKEHAKVGVQALIDHPFFALFDEMGAMKSAQAIVAAQFLFTRGVIDRVVVVAPSSVRTGVWYDEELGELARHLWTDVPSTITEYHSRIRAWKHGPETATAEERLRWVVTNYEFIRPIDYTIKVTDKAKDHRLVRLLGVCSPKTLLILDESSAVKNSKSAQSKACMQLRQRCGRVALLNGTPISNSPGDMFSQGNIMSKTILNCPSYTQFCRRYAIMKPVLSLGGKPLTSKRGFAIKTVDTWSGIEDINKRFVPYVLRRLKKDCLDLPTKLPPVMLTVPLDPATWKIYREMRDELVVWLTNSTVSQAPQAMTKIMRLAQITSGFLGGVEGMRFDEPEHDEWMNAGDHNATILSVQEISREKLDLFMQRLDEHLIEDPTIKILVRSRFRPEVLRLHKELMARGIVETGMIIGGQSKDDRRNSLRILDPRTMPAGSAVIVMSVSAGARGLNLTASHTMYTLSNDFSLDYRLQSDDRLHRPGQTSPVSYFDIVATGPQGQKTIDHRTLAMLMAKHDLATLTTSGWLGVLREEAA